MVAASLSALAGCMAAPRFIAYNGETSLCSLVWTLSHSAIYSNTLASLTNKVDVNYDVAVFYELTWPRST
jgi:hypothetical protein